MRRHRLQSQPLIIISSMFPVTTSILDLSLDLIFLRELSPRTLVI